MKVVSTCTYTAYTAWYIAGSPRAEMRACNNHGGNSITRGLQRPRVPIGGDCQINKTQNKLKKYAEEQQI